MHSGCVGRLVGFNDPELASDATQLPDQILPLADTQIVQEFVAAHAPERTARQLISLLTQITPEVQIGHEVRVLVSESCVTLASGLLALGGPLPTGGDGQRRRPNPD